MHHMVAVTGQEAQREQLFVVVEGRLDVSPPAQAVSNHIGINRVALIQIHVAFLEVSSQPWVEQKQLVWTVLKDWVAP
jgi:hypothetical protein